MSAERAFVLYSSNYEATDYYLNIVSEAFERSGFETVRVSPDKGLRSIYNNAKKNDLVFVPSALEFCKTYCHGFRRVAFWSQGVVPEESYMRNGSSFRFQMLNLVERFALKNAIFCLFVSNSMRSHYERKYNLSFSDRHYVMPCCGGSLRSDLFGNSSRYSKPTFAYAGSLARWQCFDKTLSFFKAIQSFLPEASLKVLTFQEKEAKAALEDADINNWTLGSVPPEFVADELKDIGYGFVLREDNLVNRVSTPTKISSYASCGVVPVFSSCIEDFSDIARATGFGCPVESLETVQQVVDYVLNPPDSADVLRVCGDLFQGYYSRDNHIDTLVPLLKGL